MNELTQSLLKAISRYDMNLKGEYKRVRKLEQLSHPYVKRVTSNRMDRIVHLENHDILVRAFSRDGKIAPVLLFSTAAVLSPVTLTVTAMSAPRWPPRPAIKWCPSTTALPRSISSRRGWRTAMP